MRRGYHWDEERSMMALYRSPDARAFLTPDEVKGWINSGVAVSISIEEPVRCPSCGRSKDCACRDCRYCIDGVPMHGQSWGGINGGKLPNDGMGS